MKLILLLSVLAPIQVLAWVSGGASTREEIRKIEELSKDPKFRAICPIKIVQQTPDIRKMIGRNVLYWETSCSREMMVHWNDDEGFPSLGLPHVVWFPPEFDLRNRVNESFPAFWGYLKAKYYNPKIPHGKLRFPHRIDPHKFPWANRYDFDSDSMTERSIANELREFLNNPTVLVWQTDYIIKQGLDAGYRVLAAERLAADKKHPDRSKQVCEQLQSLMSTGVGLLSVVDYANFKGDGVDWRDFRGPREVRWGLKQVLEQMASVPIHPEFKKATNDSKRREFASSAMANLTNLAHAGDDPSAQAIRKKYLTKNGGWFNRILTVYAKGGVPAKMCQIKPFVEETATGDILKIGAIESRKPSRLSINSRKKNR